MLGLFRDAKTYNAMRIAFDLDDTLIPTRPDVPTEKGLLHAVVRLFFRERLREGTGERLRQRWHEVLKRVKSGKA